MLLSQQWLCEVNYSSIFGRPKAIRCMTSQSFNDHILTAIISCLSRYREIISSCEEINPVGVGYYEYESAYTSINVYSRNVIFYKRGAN